MRLLVLVKRTRIGRRATPYVRALVLVRARRGEGQTMVEYAVVLGVITLAIVTTFGILSGTIGTAVTDVAGRV